MIESKKAMVTNGWLYSVMLGNREGDCPERAKERKRSLSISRSGSEKAKKHKHKELVGRLFPSRRDRFLSQKEKFKNFRKQSILPIVDQKFQRIQWRCFQSCSVWEMGHHRKYVEPYEK